MSQLVKDVIAFLGTLSFIDFVLYFAVLVLVILIITLIYVMRSDEIAQEVEPSFTSEPLDLKQIVETIDENPEPVVDMTAYEAEQEEKAIISYDELIQSSRQQPLKCEQERMVDDEVFVKKISLSDLPKPFEQIQNDHKVSPVQLMRYEREEAFLKALKQLNELLN